MAKKKSAKKTAIKRATKKAAKKVATKKKAVNAGGRPRGTGKLPASDDHAPTLRHLATRLSRDLASIQAWNKIKGNPGRDETGQFHVPSWESWMAETGKNFKDTSEPGKNARARKAEVDAQIQEIKLQQLLGEVGKLDEVVEVVGKILGELKQELMSFGQRNSERLAGQDQGKLEKIIDDRMREVLEQLAIPDEKKIQGTAGSSGSESPRSSFPSRSRRNLGMGGEIHPHAEYPTGNSVGLGRRYLAA